MDPLANSRFPVPMNRSRIRKGDRLLFRPGLPWTATSTQRGLQPESGCDAALPLGGPKRLLPIHTGAKGREVVVEQGGVESVAPLR